MGGNEIEGHTYLPGEGRELAKVRRFLDADGASDGTLHLCLERDGERVELPDTLGRMLVQAVEEMGDEKAVTLVPWPTKLTTQQAADILEVSRTTVIRLIADGELPAERPGTRRKLRLADVLEYRTQRRQRQHEMLAEAFEGLSVAADDEDRSIAIADAADSTAQIGEVIELPSRRR